MDIEIDYVLSVSSEDESSPASNLTMGRRWTVAEKGISEAIVDLKFKKSSIINSISIGRVWIFRGFTSCKLQRIRYVPFSM